MFSNEYDGYNKNEVDRFISKLKSEHEASLMEEKLKVLESEKRFLDLKNKSYEIENREKNILSALDAFKRYQAEGNKTIENLRIEQLKLVYEELLILFKELSIQYVGIENNESVSKIVKDIKKILKQCDIQEDGRTSLAKTENDSMRMLLNKMKSIKREREPREVKIERNDERRTQIKPVCDLKIEQGESFDTLADKYLSSPVAEQPKTIKRNCGFDLKEAINPKECLEEIMKAFDFFNGEIN